jgi:hypothetical protein
MGVTMPKKRKPHSSKAGQLNRCPSKKKGYRDKIGAMLALAETTRASRGSDRDEARYYRCPKCSWWHLTSTKRR